MWLTGNYDDDLARAYDVKRLNSVLIVKHNLPMYYSEDQE